MCCLLCYYVEQSMGIGRGPNPLGVSALAQLAWNAVSFVHLPRYSPLVSVSLTATLSVEFDDSVGPSVTAVDNSRALRFLVHKEEEVVSDNFHLVDCVVERHWLCRVKFLPDHHWRVAHLRFRDFPWVHQVHRCLFGFLDLFGREGLLEGSDIYGFDEVSLYAALRVAPFVYSAEAFLQFVESKIQRTEPVVG